MESKYCCVETDLGGKKMRLETGLLAKQADGSVLVSYGKTVILATVTCGEKMESGDEIFLPLTCDYREMTFAAGKFPGGFIKRENRPSTKEILTSRLIDRPIRPLFPKGFCNEVQVIVVVLSADQENEPDILAMNGAAAALFISGIPVSKTIGSVRVGSVDDKFIINPTYSDLEKSPIDLVVSGTRDGVIMVEGSGKEVSEEKTLEAIIYAHTYIKQIIDLQLKLKERWQQVPSKYELAKQEDKFLASVEEKYLSELQAVFFTPGKKDRNAAMKKVFKKMVDELCPKRLAFAVDKDDDFVNSFPRPADVKIAYDRMEAKLVRSFALEGKRADGRGNKDIRKISIKLGVVPCAHGSAIFARGETQALVTVTLGTQRDRQIVDGLMEKYEKRFMLHYNFWPFSASETKPLRGPGRREIGHGNLAERALTPIIPSEDDFPYTIRIVSDILDSNGSTSMASVCGGTLALMDAGVKISSPVAGIAMGLVKEGDKYCILSDILGSEDAHGDMDFKVAGTEKGITALQMDLKTDGISFDIMSAALRQAKEGRLFILSKMMEAISKPRENISENAPHIVRIPIDKDKIGLLIGPGGKTIRQIQSNTETVIEINDETNTVMLSAKDSKQLQLGKEMIEAIIEEPKVGNIYRAKVVTIKDFGAFVEIIPSGQEGLLHISEISDTFVKSIEERLKIGDEISVKLISIDENGRLSFSLKQARKNNTNNK